MGDLHLTVPGYRIPRSWWRCSQENAECLSSSQSSSNRNSNDLTLHFYILELDTVQDIHLYLSLSTDFVSSSFDLVQENLHHGWTTLRLVRASFWLVNKHSSSRPTRFTRLAQLRERSVYASLHLTDTMYSLIKLLLIGDSGEWEHNASP